MRTMMGAAVVLVLLVGCSSSDEAVGSGNGTCAQRAGSYLGKYTARSGTCGDQAEAVINIVKQPTTVDAPCTGTIGYTADNCEVTYTTTCPLDTVQAGAKLTVQGHSKWSTDANRAEATEGWLIVNAGGQALCQGTYDVTLMRP